MAAVAESPEAASMVPQPVGALAPLRRAVFRALWIAALASNVGTWMQEVGAAWLMTSLTPSPFLVTLIQVGSSLPMFLLAVPSGALADILDRRRLLLATQTWMLAAATMLGALTLAGKVNPPILLAVTFAMGMGVALNRPAWQAIVSELVPRSELPAAIALNSAGFNSARAIGPALGGLVVAAAGPGPAFFLNAASFLGTVFVLYRWQRRVPASPLPAERLVGAMRGGLRYVRYTPELRAVIVRAAGFIVFAIALLALLPVIARVELGRGPGAFGVLLGALGAGAVTGAALRARLRDRLSGEHLMRVGAVVFAACCLVVAHGHSFPLVCGAMWVAGICWLTLLSGFHVVAQSAVAGWVRGRALSVYLLVFSACMALGSATWGALASWVGAPWSLSAAALCLVATQPILGRFRLPALEGYDLSPTTFTPAPRADFPLDRGPVMVTVRYEVANADRAAFESVMSEMEQLRRRNGAVGWSLYEDPEAAGVVVEVFLVESWAEHLRQHERATKSDAAIRDRARALHRGVEPPQVAHLLAVE
jgi:predicted MFS family arabinose efflux permease/quinol monooxygenase YgiN